jgi:hypothetical protein
MSSQPPSPSSSSSSSYSLETMTTHSSSMTTLANNTVVQFLPQSYFTENGLIRAVKSRVPPPSSSVVSESGGGGGFPTSVILQPRTSSRSPSSGLVLKTLVASVSLCTCKRSMSKNPIGMSTCCIIGLAVMARAQICSSYLVQYIYEPTET